MNTISNRANCNMPLLLNQNRIEEQSKKDAILTMGLSICQVGCMGGGQSYRYYRARH
jgi:hypothetical protein